MRKQQHASPPHPRLSGCRRAAVRSSNKAAAQATPSKAQLFLWLAKRLSNLPVSISCVVTRTSGGGYGRHRARSSHMCMARSCGSPLDRPEERSSHVRQGQPMHTTGGGVCVTSLVGRRGLTCTLQKSGRVGARTSSWWWMWVALHCRDAIGVAPVVLREEDARIGQRGAGL